MDYAIYKIIETAATELNKFKKNLDKKSFQEFFSKNSMGYHHGDDMERWVKVVSEESKVLSRYRSADYFIYSLSKEFLYIAKKTETKLSSDTQEQIYSLCQWCLYILDLMHKKDKLANEDKKIYYILRFTALLLYKAKEMNLPACFIVPQEKMKAFLTCFFNVIQESEKLSKKLNNVLKSNLKKPVLMQLYSGKFRRMLNQLSLDSTSFFGYEIVYKNRYNQHLLSLKRSEYDSKVTMLSDDILFYIADYLGPEDLYSFFIAMYTELKQRQKEKDNRLALASYYELLKKPVLAWSRYVHAPSAFSANFSPCRRYIAVIDSRGIVLLDYKTGQSIWKVEEPTVSKSLPIFSPCGKYILLAFDDKQTIKLLSVRTGKYKWTVTEPTAYSFPPNFSPSGQYIVLVFHNQAVISFWDFRADQRKSIAMEQVIGWLVSSVSLCEQYIVSISSDHTMKLWEIKTGQCKWKAAELTDCSSPPIFSPCGRYFVSATFDCAIKFWDYATGQCKWTGREHVSFVFAINFSSCGQYIVSTSDKAVKLWDCATGQCIWTLPRHNTEWRVPANFSSCGQYIILASSSHTIEFWKVFLKKIVNNNKAVQMLEKKSSSNLLSN